MLLEPDNPERDEPVARRSAIRRDTVRRTLIVTGMLLITVCQQAVADEKRHTDSLRLFHDSVRGILERRCLSCHNSNDQKGDFSLQKKEELTDSGYLTVGDPSSSHLLTVLLPDSDGNAPSMPKDSDPLTSEEIEVIRAWIGTGASWPDSIQLSEPVISDFAWWSLQPVRQPPIPEVSATDRDWVKNPIDHFVAAAHQKAGLHHSPEADRRTLIRRLSYDLLGLPPTPEETAAFENDSSGDAWERLVDRMLDSPHYGERWARHWLDVVKYADTCGYDKDKLRPNAWPYRDYVIRSINDDKPYTQFVQEQIAGDVLFPGSPDGILGLGFIAAGPWDFIGHVEVPESKIDGMVARNLDRDDMVTNTLNTFCSVTIQCARCHNHKFDPFTQQHYYSLQSVFAAVDRAERPYDTDPAVEQRRADLQKQQQSLD
ncbi:MAG: DUF1549 domain-containing protein, partial [Planctomycetaceae bacterium]|nr:DUF1549 domain-containing protein [Planctomycetaceae bacterium]